MKHITDRLIEAIVAKKSPIVVGLDPRWESLPSELVGAALDAHGETAKAVSEAFIAFNRGIIDAVCDLVPAIKPQIAFFEQYGIDGLVAYKDACEYAMEKGLIVVADVKRGDIGSTSKAYSNAYLGSVQIGSKKIKGFESDYATINPYLGDDCISEFIDEVKKDQKGIFVLVKTSNSTSGQLQDLYVGNQKVYEKVAHMVNKWSTEIVGDSGYSPVGAVVGATYPEELEKLRALMPKTLFLVPGYGAQGGGAKDVVAAFNADGLGAIVNNSRGILYAYQKTDKAYQEAARAATIEMREAINSALEAAGKKYW